LRGRKEKAKEWKGIEGREGESISLVWELKKPTRTGDGGLI